MDVLLGAEDSDELDELDELWLLVQAILHMTQKIVIRTIITTLVVLFVFIIIILNFI